MIRHIPFQATHKGVYDILSLRQTTKTYDTVPDHAEFPCISFGPFTSKPGGAKNVDISDISLQLHVWSMDTSKKEIEEICNEVASVLTSWPLEIASLGFSALGQDVDFCEIFEEEEISYHAVLTFTAKIQYIGG